MAVAYLANIADNILHAALDGLAEATTGRPAPDKVFLSHGPPVMDGCDQLSVHVEILNHVYQEDPTSPRTVIPSGGVMCAVEPVPTFVITLARCVPGVTDDGYLPSATALDTSAEDLLVDLWAILTELYDRVFARTLFPGQVECADVVIGTAEPLPPQGGFGGWEIRVTTTTNDAGPTGS